MWCQKAFFNSKSVNIFPSIIDNQKILSLNEYWHIVLKRKRVAITFFVVAVLSTTFYSLILPKTYKATTKILIEQASKNILAFQDVFSVQTTGLDYYPTQYSVLKSRSVAKRVMDDLNLWPQFNWANDPIKAFLTTIEIDPVKQTRLVDVSAYSKNPKQVADIANAVVKFYIEQNLDKRLMMTQQAASWIHGKIEDVRNKLAKSELQFEVVKLRKELAELNEKYLPKHPEVVRATGRLTVLEQQLGNDLKDLASGNLSVLYNQLEHEVESNRKIFESMSSRLKETMVSEGMENTNVVVIDLAEVPTRPVAPRVLLNIFLSILIGAFGGSALCLLIESLDNTLKSPEDIEHSAQLPVLGVVSAWNAESQKLIVQTDPSSSIAEAFRAIRTSLLFSSSDKPFRTLLITSPYSGEGKTVICSNLAVTIAMNGSSVLLIEADMRKPSLHKVIPQLSPQGLSNALSDTDDDPSEFISQTNIPNLSVLFAGPIPPMPSELLGSQKMRRLIEKWREHFDYILLDSPPFMAVTDPVVLSSFLDGVVLVTRYNKTPKHIVAKAKNKFLEVHAKIIGVVINAVDFKQEGYHYPYHSYYGSSYANQEKGFERLITTSEKSGD